MPPWTPLFGIAAAVVIMLLWMAFFWVIWKYWGDDLIQWFSAS